MRVRVRVEVPRGARVLLDVEVCDEDGQPIAQRELSFGALAPARTPLALPRPNWSAAAAALPVWLTFAALAIYAITRLVALPDFPIYFFTDEAIQTMMAADLVRDHFVGLDKVFLPTYFENGSQYNLSASVYLQVLPYMLFGKSIWITRGVAALMTLIAAGSVGMIFKRIFKSPYPWLAVLVLSVTPVWFLHSRTAFETALAASFYALFLYFYLVYRLENPRALYGAVIAGALVFYSYAPMRLVIGVNALLLLLVDLKYHWQNRLLVAKAFGLALLLAVPFFRFLILHPTESEWHLRMLNSYWLSVDLTLPQKLGRFGQEYVRGLDPFYWYMPNPADLSRHIMPGYGHLLRPTLPFGLAGVVLALIRIRRPEWRVLLLAVLSVPVGAAIVQIGATRLLAMAVPMAMITALAIAEGLEWLHRRKNISRGLMSGVVFALLAGVNVYMLRDALVNGPTWYSDYGLGGMQYGGRQLFGEIKTYLGEKPETHLVVSPSWANGTDVVARFFFDDPLPFDMGTARGYYTEGKPIDDNTVFVMIPEEMEELPRQRFAEVNVERTVSYPNGEPGFFFTRLKYVDNLDAVLEQEKAARRELKLHRVELDGQTVDLGLTTLDMGEPKNLFDGDTNTLVRSYNVNPMQIQVDFSAPRRLTGVTARIGGAKTTLTVHVWTDLKAPPVVFTQQLDESPVMRDAKVEFGEDLLAARVLVEVMNTLDLSDGNVHVWELTFDD